MTDCGTSITSVSFASSNNFDQGGVKLTNSTVLTELQQIAVANSLKSEISNWIIIGANNENTSNCSLHMEVAPMLNEETTVLHISFYIDGTLSAVKVAEGLVSENQTATVGQFNDSGINISLVWSGNLPRNDISKVFYQVLLGVESPEPRIMALSSVSTIVVHNGNLLLGTDGSDSKGTMNSTYAKSLSFGNLAPGETSKTMILYLHVPSATAIVNIRLGLIDSGGLSVQQNTFGVTSQGSIDQNLEPEEYFSGLNTTGNAADENNVDIANRDFYTSDYVYLNVSLPKNQDFGTGVIRYRWYFDYA